MRAAVLAVCALGMAGLWGWSLFWPKPVVELPERYCGEFVLVRFEPPKKRRMANPFPAGQERHFTFRKDGTYLIRTLVSNGYEMAREEGYVSLDQSGVLHLERISENRTKAHAEWRYDARWGQDTRGAYLLLTHLPEGDRLYLRLKGQKSG